MFFLNTAIVHCQFVLTNYPEVVIGGVEGMSGNGISLYDFNGDGIDDLTCATMNNGVHTYVNSETDFEEIFLFNFIDGDIKQVFWVDYDNDIDPDFFCTIYGGGCRLFRNDGELTFTETTDVLDLQSENALCFGAAWADFDNDGWLDVAIANYDFILPGAHSNWLLHSNGDGTFSDVTEFFGLGNSFKATFQPAWIDVNLDHRLDLFFINDKYHGNDFYLANENGFSLESDAWNLNHEMEAMSNSWCDFDGDLDFDVYISNTIEGNLLMRNDGDHFTNIADALELEINSVCWNALWLDANHDMHTDLHVANNAFYLNNNQNSFFIKGDDGLLYPEDIQGDANSVLSEAKGDFNNDGFWDIVQLTQYPVSAKFFQNLGGDNHWLKLALTGTASNAEGIGALLRYYVDAQEFLTCHQCGAGYISQDSKYDLISLKNSDQLDSLFVEWPSGWIDKYYALPAGNIYEVVEGETFAPTIFVEENIEICNGDSIYLNAGEFSSHFWQNESDESFQWIDEECICSVTVSNDFGFVHSDTVYVSIVELPELQILSSNPLCPDGDDGSITISSLDTSQYSIHWYLGSDLFSISNLSSGVYEYTLSSAIGCLFSDAVIIEAPDPLSALIKYETPCFGQETFVELEISGGTGDYEIETPGWNPEYVGAGVYSLFVVDNNGCTLDSTFEIVANEEIILAGEVLTNPENNETSIYLEASGGEPPFTFDWSTGASGPVLVNVPDGFFSCFITDVFGCIAQYDTTIVFNSIHSLSDNLLVISKDNMIEIHSSIEREFVLMNALGKILKEGVVSPGSNQLTLTSMARGIYYLMIDGRVYKLISQ